MHYDLTLNNLKIPNITGTFPFGTKVTPSDLNKGGLSTTEVNTNMMMPFANMRPKVVDEDGDTTTVEYDAKLVFSARSGTTPSAGYSVVMGQGAYVGCTVTFTNLMSYSCKVYQYDGTTTLFDIPSGNTFQAVWNGSVWVWTTCNAISAYDYRPVSSAAVHAAIGGGAWIPSNGYDPLVNETGFYAYSVQPDKKIAQGVPPSLSEYATIFGCNLAVYQLLLYIDVFGSVAIWGTNQGSWRKLANEY